MKNEYLVVIDPVSSGCGYGLTASSMGLWSIALISGSLQIASLSKIINVAGFDYIVEIENLADALERLQGKAIAAVVPGSDYGVELADLISSLLGLPGNNPNGSALRINKYLAAKELALVGIRADGCILLDEKGNGPATDIINYPIIIKHTHGTGSVGVFKCNGESDLIHSIALSQQYKFGGRDFIYIEPYYSGTEYFATVLNRGPNEARVILCVGRYEKFDDERNPGMYKTISLASQCDGFWDRCLEFCTEVNICLGMDYGINDVEFKYDGTNFHFIEQNARLSGARVPDMIKECCGLDCRVINIMTMRGDVVELKEIDYKKYFSICSIPSLKDGIIEEIFGLSEIKYLDSYLDSCIYTKLEDSVNKTTDFSNSLGLIFLASDDQESLKIDVQKIHQNISVIYKSA